MTGVRDHTELDVWNLCDDLCNQVSGVTERPGFARHSKLRDQIKDAAESPCPNIAEGFARYFPRDNARFVHIARGSLTELIVHLGRARASRLITQAEADSLCKLALRARKAATGYILYLQSATPPKPSRKKQEGKPTHGREPDP